MNANFHIIAIDVGSQELVCALHRKGHLHILSFTNDALGRERLLCEIRRSCPSGASVRIGMEATGTYSLELALFFSAHADLQLSIINPKTIKHFLRAQGARGKTDKIDAAGIHRFLELMPFRPWAPPPKLFLALQSIARRIYQLNQERTREDNRLKGLSPLEADAKAVICDLKVAIRQIDSRIEKLQAAAMDIIQSDSSLSRKYEIITSIRGVAEKSAIRLLGELLVLDPEMKSSQWVAMAGLDPRPRQSGTSLDGHRYISKAGNKYIRSALYMPALVAIQKEDAFKNRYVHLINERNKPKMVALVAAMRKLLTAIYGMLKTDTPFDPTKLHQAHQPKLATQDV